MKEINLFKIALSCSILGLILLFFISEQIEIDETAIDKIDETDIGESVKIIGKIETINDVGNLVFIDINQEKIESVSVMLFKDSDIILKKGDYVEIIGDIDEYEGKKEVIANRIRLI